MLKERFALNLADGTRLEIEAADETAAPIVSFLAKAAQLVPATGSSNACRLAVARNQRTVQGADCVCELGPLEISRLRVQNIGSARTFVQASERLSEEQWRWQQLVRLSACIGRETLPRGGVMLHSGLAAIGTRDEARGVLLAGRSGVGKSTASRRLPPPWHPLADDVTLVVRASDGSFWAHPWPTWSRFFGPEAGDGSDTWKVDEAVQLRAVFVLEQGEKARLEPLGRGHAVAQLAELARQTSMLMVRDWPQEELAAFNRLLFANIGALARVLPAYRLHTDLGAAFWGEIEKVLC